jgi:tRNA(Ile)-lysidine synthase
VESETQSHRRGRPSLARKAEQLIIRERMFPDGSSALVMVSGGQDSLALLHLLAATRGIAGRPVSIHALHVNHHLRGPESDADEVLVVKACGELGVGLTVAHRPVDKNAGNVQEAARDARREAAAATARERGCSRIALGHTADDQVETMLYRLGRYGGLAAFVAMKPCEPPWVRPLLGCRRGETAAYCGQHGLVFAEDRGNAYPGYARTAIRDQILPAWEGALAGAVESACRTAEVAAEIQGLVEKELTEVAPAVAYGSPLLEEAECLSAAALLDLDASLRRLVIHRWLEGRGRAGGASGGGGGGVGVRGGHPIRAERTEGSRSPDVAHEAFIDAGAIEGPLAVRAPQPGDRLRPLGSPGVRKLQDVFVDLHVPRRRRGEWPLVLSRGRILWVCGLVIAEECRIGAGTRGAVRLSWDGETPTIGTAGSGRG